MRIAYIFTAEEIAFLEKILSQPDNVSNNQTIVDSLIDKGFLSITEKKMHVDPVIALMMHCRMKCYQPLEYTYNQNCLTVYKENNLYITALQRTYDVQLMCFQTMEEILEAYPGMIKKEM